MTDDAPRVVPFRGWHSSRGTTTTYLPGDAEILEESRRETALRRIREYRQARSMVSVCNICATDMPPAAVYTGEVDGQAFAVCLDARACEARKTGKDMSWSSGTWRQRQTESLTQKLDWLIRRVDVLETRAGFPVACGPDCEPDAGEFDDPPQSPDRDSDGQFPGQMRIDDNL